MESSNSSNPDSGSDSESDNDIEVVDDAPAPDDAVILFEQKDSKLPAWKFARLVAKKTASHKPVNKIKTADAAKAYCLICKEKKKNPFIMFSKGNPNSVKRHFNRLHADEIREESAKTDGEREPSQKKKKTLPIDHYFSSSGYDKLPEPTEADRQLGDSLTLDWITGSLRPFLTVEDPGLVKLVEFLCSIRSKYQLPSRKQVRGQMMCTATLVMEQVKVTLKKEVDNYSMTTDIWSSSVMQSFMAVTVHYLTSDFQMKSFLLQMLPLKGSHTGAFIAQVMLDTFATYGLPKTKLTMLLRDNASNAVKACRDLQVSHFGCIGHPLHLVVGPFLLEKKSNRRAAAALQVAGSVTPEQSNNTTDQGTASDDDVENIVPTASAERAGPPNEEENDDVTVDDENEDDDVEEYSFLEEESTEESEAEIVGRVAKIVSKFRTIAIYVRKSPKTKDKIISLAPSALRLNQDTISISLDVRTRWNSALVMLQSLLKMRVGIESFLNHLKMHAGRKEFNNKKLPDISDHDWVLIEGSLLLLPFKMVTEELSGVEYPTFSEAMPKVRDLKSLLSKGADARSNMFSVHSDIAPIKAFMMKYQGEDEADVINTVARDLKACSGVLFNSFTKRFAALSSEILWVTFLDPRCRKMSHLSNAERGRAKQLFINEVLAVSKTTYDSTVTIEESEEEEEEHNPYMMQSYFDSAQKERESTGPSSSGDHLAQVQRQIDNYLDPSIRVMKKQDPLKWWKEHWTRFPYVAMVARKWLCVPGTSTAPERVFSHCGFAFLARRSCMKGDALMNQILLKYNKSKVTIDLATMKEALKKAKEKAAETPDNN